MICRACAYLWKSSSIWWNEWSEMPQEQRLSASRMSKQNWWVYSEMKAWPTARRVVWRGSTLDVEVLDAVRFSGSSFSSGWLFSSSGLVRAYVFVQEEVVARAFATLHTQHLCPLGESHLPGDWFLVDCRLNPVEGYPWSSLARRQRLEPYRWVLDPALCTAGAMSTSLCRK